MLLRIVFSSLLFISSSYAGELTLTFHNLRSEEGHIRIALHDTKGGFPGNYEDAVELLSVKAREGASVTITGLTEGYYAAAVFHDEDSNEDLNRNALGIPKEGFGFTRNPRLIFGPPTFKRCRLWLGQNQIESTEIYMKHL